MAAIGTPLKIVQNVLRTGEYKPFVPAGSIRKNKEKVQDFQELLAKKVDDDDGNNFDEITLFDEDNQQVLELSVSGKSHLIIAEQIMTNYHNF